MSVDGGLVLQQVTLAVQHLYRDGDVVAAELGGMLRDGGWYPGTGVGHKYVDVDGVRVNVVSVVDYRASRASEFGYAVYEAARTGTSLLRLTFAGRGADGASAALPAVPSVTESYRRADGLAVPSARVAVLAAGPTCAVHLTDGPADGAPGRWRVRWGAGVDWAAQWVQPGTETDPEAALTAVTYEPADVCYRASDPATLMAVRRN